MESYWPTAVDQPNPSKHDIEHATWYKQVQKIVLSKTMKGKKLDNTTIVSENAGDYVRQIKQDKGKEIIIFGSPSCSHYLLKEGLIDDLWLFVNPVLLGKGIPMFKHIDGKTDLKRVTSHAFPTGVVCLHYETLQKNKE